VSPLLDILRAQRIQEVYCCGLALEYCVAFTALDLKMLMPPRTGVYLLEDACRGISPKDVSSMIERMRLEQVVVMNARAGDASFDCIPDKEDWSDDSESKAGTESAALGGGVAPVVGKHSSTGSGDI